MSLVFTCSCGRKHEITEVSETSSELASKPAAAEAVLNWTLPPPDVVKPEPKRRAATEELRARIVEYLALNPGAKGVDVVREIPGKSSTLYAILREIKSQNGHVPKSEPLAAVADVLDFSQYRELETV